MKDVNYYLALKYPIELLETEDGFVASHPDLPGCASFGDTAQEAVESLGEVRKLWLQGQVEANGEAPEPRPEEEFSGKFVVRLPKWLHRVLDQEARRQASSLNTFVVSLLSAGINSGRGTTKEIRPIKEEWRHLQETWEAAAQDNAIWSMQDYLQERGIKKRSTYIGMFASICKRKSVREAKKHLEEFSSANDVQEEKCN